MIAINLFAMLPGVDPAEFEHFSTHLDRPTCLGRGDVVRSFEVYRVLDTPADAAPADIIEVMRVADWQTWVRFRDNDPSMKPVTEGFDALVDPATVRTYLTRPVNGDAK
ncbi:hypothetical protein CIW52_30525 [Mycolicibacterium sp. P9-64]|nr:hypothetical protein CIW52_30525 [Mycolicibacterium sp. P9-64]